MPSDLDLNDNIHAILADSSKYSGSVSIFDYDPGVIQAKELTPEKEDDTLRSVMVDAIDEVEEFGDCENIPQEKLCQTFFLPTKTKTLFEQICKNNCTTPSAFLRNVCVRLVESYFGKVPA